MTKYIFHYDLENPDLCVKAAPVLVELHQRYNIPATFFMLGRVLEQKGNELCSLFSDDPLFDIQSHTYAHKMLKDSRMHGPGISVEEVRQEITLGKKWVEDVFARPCIGVRSGCGFLHGFQGEPERIAVLAEADIKYFSSDLRGPADSIPAGLVQAYWYDIEGFPELLEMPGHGWHDNVLKAKGGGTWLSLPWPSVLSWGVPNRPPQTPEEEFAVQKVWIDRAVAEGLDYISLVYHPHSIYRMSTQCRTMELIMQYLQDVGMPTTTYSELYKYYADEPASVPGRNAWTWEQQVIKEPLRVG